MWAELVTLFGDPQICGIWKPVRDDYRHLRRDQAPNGPYGSAQMKRLDAFVIAWRRRPK